MAYKNRNYILNSNEIVDFSQQDVAVINEGITVVDSGRNLILRSTELDKNFSHTWSEYEGQRWDELL